MYVAVEVAVAVAVVVGFKTDADDVDVAEAVHVLDLELVVVPTALGVDDEEHVAIEVPVTDTVGVRDDDMEYEPLNDREANGVLDVDGVAL